MSIPYEDDYSHWVTEGIVRFFEDLYYRVFHSTIGQTHEAFIPLDRLYTIAPPSGPVYLFALQFKRPMGSGRPYWQLVKDEDDDQFRLIRQHHSDWIWYCLPYFRKHEFHRVALHLSHFCRATRFCATAKTVEQVPDNLLLSRPSCGTGAPLDDLLMCCCLESDCCGNHSDQEMHRLCSTLRRLRRKDARCLCALSSPSQWGSVFGRVLAGDVGVPIPGREALRSFFDERLRQAELSEGAVVVAVDVIGKAVSIVDGFGGTGQSDMSGNDESSNQSHAQDWPL